MEYVKNAKGVLKMNKKIFIVILIIFLLLTTGCENKNQKRINLIGSNFPCYDFLRAITKGATDVNVEMLLPKGVDMHHYEPTAKDIINIDKSNLFVYVGGESDSYLSNILNDLNKKETLKIMDMVNLDYEELQEGMEGEIEEEYDEHVWTSLKNTKVIIEKIKNELIKIDEINKDLYEENAKNYINEIDKLDKEIEKIINNSKRKEIIFADRFPLQYFAKSYNLKYYAAFKGCSESTEASNKTISFLIDKVKSDNIPVIFKIELSNGNIAETVSKETNTKILEFNSMHNISLDDFNNNETYISIMKKNINNLKEALN